MEIVKLKIFFLLTYSNCYYSIHLQDQTETTQIEGGRWQRRQRWRKRRATATMATAMKGATEQRQWQRWSARRLQWLPTARQQSTSDGGDGQGQRDDNATATALTAMVGATEQRQCGNGHEKYNNQLAKAAMDGATAMDGNGRCNRETVMAAMRDGR